VANVLGPRLPQPRAMGIVRPGRFFWAAFVRPSITPGARRGSGPPLGLLFLTVVR